jgi:site-specific DNA recombinase
MRKEVRDSSTAKPVGIWVRVSTEDQARGDSPEHHEKRARFYAEAKGWSIITVYHLEGVSGKSVLEHPEAQRMMSDVEQGRISGLIFSKIARLARNTRELLDFADKFEKHGADLISLQESIDTSSPAGRLFYTIIAAMAQWEREEIAERVAASVPIRARLGKSLGGAAPFGYRWVDKKLVIDEKEAPTRRQLFALFAEHKRKRTVARLLNESGHRTRNGGKFTGKSIERLLVDPLAKGSRRMNYRQSPGRGGREKSPADWVYVDAPAIVSEDLWEEVNQILRAQGTDKGPPAKKTAHLFSGIVFCAKCDCKMYVLSKGTSYVCKECRNKVGEEDLEIVFIEQLRGTVSSPQRVTSLLERTHEKVAERKRLLGALEAQHSAARTEADSLYRLYVDGNISGAMFAERNGPLEERLRQLGDEIPRVAGELDFQRLQLLSSDEVLSEARDLYSRWPTLVFEERQQIVEGITDRIVISDNEITIQLAYLPFDARPVSPKDGANGARTVVPAGGREFPVAPVRVRRRISSGIAHGCPGRSQTGSTFMCTWEPSRCARSARRMARNSRSKSVCASPPHEPRSAHATETTSECT